MTSASVDQRGYVCACQGCERTGLGSGLGKRNIQSPLLPAHVLVCLCKKVCLSPSLLEELHNELASPSGQVRAVYGTYQCYRALIDQRF